MRAFNQSTRKLLLRQGDLGKEQSLLKNTLYQVQAAKHSLEVKATADLSTIAGLEEYARSLETQVRLLQSENADLTRQNRGLRSRERSQAKLESAVERLSKDKARLLELMRHSSEFRLLGLLCAPDSQVTHLHSLGFFSDYDVERVQLTNKFGLRRDADVRRFNAGLRRASSSAKQKGAPPARPPSGCGLGASGNHVKARPCRVGVLRREEELWVDQGLRDFAVEMGEQLSQRFSEEAVDLLLFRLNAHFLAKVDAIRKAGHLFCKFCRGTPPQNKGVRSGARNLDFIQTLKNYGGSWQAQ